MNSKLNCKIGFCYNPIKVKKEEKDFNKFLSNLMFKDCKDNI